MATENKEIGDIVKKCKILLLDIEGTTTSISFVKDKLFPYAEQNVKHFLESQWETDEVKAAVAALRALASEDQEAKVEGVVSVPAEDATKEEQIEGLVSSVKWLMSADRKAGALKQLQGLIWKQGYESGDIRGHVYDDVSAALEQWHKVDGQKVYIYSSGSVKAQKLLFGQSTAGDLLRFLEGHFDTEVGPKQEATSYTTIVEKIGCKADEVLFLTDIVKEAEAARSAGVHAALVSREGNTPLPAEVTISFPVLHSLSELTVTNKRKPETQDEIPAKIAKTDIGSEVKTTSEKQPVKTTKGNKATEKMDVEESAVKESEQKIEIVEVAEIKAESVVNIEPIVEEPEEKETKTDKKQTESIETEIEKIEGEKNTENVAEKSSIVVTDISDKTDTKISDVGDIIEDLVQIVEEPADSDAIKDLQNVGDVLEKECDDILSKVHDVTNLNNMQLKPLLNPIAEETMETDNADSNDIMDRILDDEQELEMEQAKKDEKKEASFKEANVFVEETKTEAKGPPEEPAKSDVAAIEQKAEDSDPLSDAAVAEAKAASDEAKTIEEVKRIETTTASDEKAPKENGQSTNGDAEKVLNGDVSKDEELNARLTENGNKENGDKVNGANGEANTAKNGQGDCKEAAVEVNEIKVKTVASGDAPCSDPIEQPTEA